MIDLLEKVTKDKLVYIKSLDPKTELVDLDFKISFSIKGGKGIEIIKDIASFSNTKGGYIIFGVSNDFQWLGLDDSSDLEFDEAKINQLCEKYIDGRIDFVYALHEIEDREFLIMYISPTKTINPFKVIGQYERERRGKIKSVLVFKEGDVYCRRGSRSVKADHLFYKQKDQDFSIVHNLPSPPFHEFIGRKSQIDKTHDLLIHPNTRLLQINGIGGIGKTSLVYYYCNSLINSKLNHNFEFIIWMSGKQTIFTPDGERKVKNFIASYRDVIFEIAQFLGERELVELPLKESADYVEELLKQHNILLVVDNMETLIEEDLISFLFNLPSNVKAILTTRESIGDFQMSAVTLKGFEEDQEYKDFLEFEYNRRTDESFTLKYGNHFSDIYKYTKGMPLALQLITNQLSLGVDIQYIINRLESGKSYEYLLSFCFQGSIEKLSELQQNILYILSIPESEEYISVEELKYITGFSEDEIIPALQKISILSLCYKEKTYNDKAGYASPHLTKIYVRQFEIKEKKELVNNYEKYLNERSQIALTDEQYIIKSRAKNHEQKIVALKVKNIMSVFYFDGYDKASRLLDEVIKLNSDFAYLYFLRGILEKESSFYQSFDGARKSFSKATELEFSLVEAWVEWGFLEQESKKYNISKQYFEQALALEPNNTRANHGLARTLAMLSSTLKQDITIGKEAIQYFEKGYYINSEEHNHKRSNAINAHAYSKHLLIGLKDYYSALEVCEYGLTFEPKNDRLLSLRGEIKKIIKDTNINNSNNTEMYTSKYKRIDHNILNKKAKANDNNYSKKNSTILEHLPSDVLNKLKDMY